MPRMIFVFLDGVGIGKPDAQNPFYAAKTAFLPFYEGASLPDGTPVKAIDATLNTAGIPQSASGQTSLFSGQNIPALIGGHKGSYPNKIMRKILKEHNLFKILAGDGIKGRYINAYPRHAELFAAPNVELDDEGVLHFSEKFPELFKRRISVTTCMLIANRTIPFDIPDIEAGRSLFQEFSNKYLNDRGAQLPEFSPEKAGEIIYNVSREYDFILYEYFQTDVYAHRRTFAETCELITNLDQLFGKLLSLLDKEQDTLLMTSDHGNLEDSSTRAHTRNPVPLLVWGKGAGLLRERINSIADVSPAIVGFFSQDY